MIKQRRRARRAAFALAILAVAGRAGGASAADQGAASQAQSGLSDEARQELADLLAGQSSWTTVSLFRNRLPHAPADAFDRFLVWNEIALDTTAIDHTPLVPGDIRPRFAEQYGPTRASRAMAMVHIAMFEAVNSLMHRYITYVGMPDESEDRVSMDCAIAQAAHDMLLALFPAQQVRLDSLLAQDEAIIAGPPDKLARGVALGAYAASAMQAMRTNDGAQAPEIKVGPDPGQFQVTPLPGWWSPDPISGQKTALGVHWGEVTPFVMQSGDQFRPPPPPALGSREYAESYEQVLNVGGDPTYGTPTIRTPRQTFIGRFWGYDGTPALCAPPRLYNMVARSVALQQGMTDVSELARYLALVNTAMADAGISGWEAKWHYQFWRPVTAIRDAGPDGDPATPGHPTWYPLGAPETNTNGPNITPPFPAYPSGHAVFGGALFEVLRGYWPDQTRFTIISDEYNGLNRDADGAIRPLLPETFRSFTEAEHDNAESRIYDGIHWEFDATSGIDAGNRIGRWVETHAFAPRARLVGIGGPVPQ